MLKRSLPVVMAALIGTLLGMIPWNAAHADTGADEAKVYTQPGDHLVNGRYWKTECAEYSSTVVRCSTSIWATKVVESGGTHVTQNGWVFNTLTYLPSSRSTWASNPLGKTGSWTASDGRQWKTECDTAATGRGGCRSYALTTVLESSAGGYVSVDKWVVNNIVQFSSPALAPVTSIPAAAPALKGVPVEGPAEAPVAEESATSERVVSAALAQVGDRYVYGASGPNSFDCSGLTSYAYRQTGISLPHSAKSQFSSGTRVSKSDLEPGDLVFYYSPISHVGIYIGDGKIVDAANPRSGVRVTTLNSMPYSGAVRVS